MNTLACLLLATCTPGADPIPVIDSRTAPMTSYSSYGNGSYGNANYGMQDWSNPQQENRPRFFARLRNLFSRKSQGMDSRISESSSGYPYQMTGNPTMGNTIISSSPMPASSTVNNFTPSTIPSQRTFTPSNGSGMQRMPTGQPTNGQPF